MKNTNLKLYYILIAIIIAIFTFLAINAVSKKTDSGVKKYINDIDDNIINGPRIKVDENSYDLGTVRFGDVAEHRFMVENVGNETLEILRLSTSCGCTKAEIVGGEKDIMPGKSAELLVTFDPATHKDNPELGKIERVIYINTNDKENPEVEINLNANVIMPEK